MHKLKKVLNGLSYLSQGTDSQRWYSTAPFSKADFWKLVGIIHESLEDEGCLLRSYKGYYEITFKTFDAPVQVTYSSNGVYITIN